MPTRPALPTSLIPHYRRAAWTRAVSEWVAGRGRFARQQAGRNTKGLFNMVARTHKPINESEVRVAPRAHVRSEANKAVKVRVHGVPDRWFTGIPDRQTMERCLEIGAVVEEYRDGRLVNSYEWLPNYGGLLWTPAEVEAVAEDAEEERPSIAKCKSGTYSSVKIPAARAVGE